MQELDKKRRNLGGPALWARFPRIPQVLVSWGKWIARWQGSKSVEIIQCINNK
jgi:hypothetical protein